jgi:hypothetical protein
VPAPTPTRSKKEKTDRGKIEVFLSYPRENRVEAEKIAKKLHENGFDIWLDKQLQPGVEWDVEIRKQIESRPVFIACVSRHTTVQTYQYKELKIALESPDGVTEGSREIIPIRLETCPLVDILAKFQWVDIFELLDEDGWTRVFGAIIRIASRTATAPCEPRTGLSRERHKPPQSSKKEITAELPPWTPQRPEFPLLPDLPASLDREKANRAKHQYLALEVFHANAKTDLMRDQLSELRGPLEPIKPWLQWMVWYDEGVRDRLTWMDLAKKICGGPLDSAQSREDFLRECSPVALQLEKAWRSSFNKAVDRFRRNLTSESLASAITSFLDETQPLLCTPWTRLIAEASRLASPPADLRSLIEVYKTGPVTAVTEGTSVIRWAQIASAQLPPSRETLLGIKRRAELATVTLEISKLLRAVAESVPDNPIELLVEDLNERFPLDVSLHEVSSALVLREQWVFALGTLLARDGDTAISLHSLRDVGRVFASAAAQANLISDWRIAEAAYLEFLEGCRETWPGALEPLDKYERSLCTLDDELLQTLPLPNPGWLDSGVPDLRKWMDHELDTIRLARETWRWLESLRDWPAMGGSIIRVSIAKLPPQWDRFRESFAVLDSELRGAPYLCESSTVNWPLEALSATNSPKISPERASQNCRELRIACERTEIARAFSLPQLDRLPANLALLFSLRDSWAGFVSSLGDGEIDRARDTLNKIQIDLRPLPWLAEVVDLIHAAQIAGKGKEDGSVFSWQETRRQVRKIRLELDQHKASAHASVPEILPEMIERAAASLDSLDSELEDVSQVEEQIRVALNDIESENFGAATEALKRLQDSLASGLSQLLRTDIVLWREAAEAISASPNLQQATIDASLLPDAVTGLPPHQEPLDLEQSRLIGIRDSAQKACEMVVLANRGSKFRCAVPEPDQVRAAADAALADLRLLLSYSACIQRVQEAIDRNEWRIARSEMVTFEPGKFLDGYSRVHSAINIGTEALNFPEPRNRISFLRRYKHRGLEHPFLAPLRRELEEMEREEEEQLACMLDAVRKLCSPPKAERFDVTHLIHTPVPADMGSLKALEALLTRTSAGGTVRREELLRAAGRNRSALLALTGDVAGVVKEAKTSKDFVPHNVLVATLCHLNRRHEAPPEIDVALGACALLRSSAAYQKSLAMATGRDLPDLAALGRELERVFVKAGISWGQDNEPDSLALRFQVEQWATMEMNNSPAAKSLPWPMGPALVDFYCLREKLLLGLRADANVRSWYGSLARPEALLRCGHPREAKAALPDASSLTELAADCPFYSQTKNPLKALREDFDALRLKCNLYELRQMHLPSQGSLDDLGARIAETCSELVQMHMQPDLLSFEIGRLFDEFSRVHGHERIECAYRCMSEILAILEQNATLKGRSRPWRIRRGEISLKLIMERPDSAPGALDSGLPEMTRLAEEAVQDNPRDPASNILRQAIRMIKVKRDGPEAYQAQRAALIKSVQTLQNRALRERWGYDSLEMIGQLLHLAEGTGDYERWFRDQSRRQPRREGG